MSIEIPTKHIQLLSAQQAWDYRIIPFDVMEQEIHFYIEPENQSQRSIQSELEMVFDKKVVWEEIPVADFSALLQRHYRRTRKAVFAERQTTIDFSDPSSFVEAMIVDAYELGASDIHLEPFEKTVRIRFRLDGKLINRFEQKKERYPAILNKIKIKSRLDIAEKRLPQDGRIFFSVNGQQFDIRVSTLPTLHGEKIVMRLLAGKGEHIELSQLGFSGSDLSNYLAGVEQPNGLILISGPTGSGKTTTLYGTLGYINDASRNIMTIENPIEYTLEGINQVQVQENIGLSFANTLRTLLRQDPDVIMVGEIRDIDTATMAIRASLTGHLVLSTIHTSSAWGIVSRLLDMGVPAFLLAETLNTVVAQRLVRKLCKHCKSLVAFDKNAFPKAYQLPRPIQEYYESNGCEHCFYTGYKGRIAIYEIINIDKIFSQQIKQGEFDISTIMEEKKIKTLSGNAFHLLEKGITSVKEIYPILATMNQ